MPLKQLLSWFGLGVVVMLLAIVIAVVSQPVSSVAQGPSSFSLAQFDEDDEEEEEFEDDFDEEDEEFEDEDEDEGEEEEGEEEYDEGEEEWEEEEWEEEGEWLEQHRMELEARFMELETVTRIAEIAENEVSAAAFALVHLEEVIGEDEQEAAEFLEEALEETDDLAIKRMLRIKLAELQMHMDNPEAAREHLRELLIAK